MDMRKYRHWKDKKLFGRISTLKRMINRRYERIEKNRLEIQQFKKELSGQQKRLKKITDTYYPKVYFKKVKSGKYTYHKGRVRFWGKDYEFHIGSEDVFNSVDTDVWKKNIQQRFRKKLTEEDLRGYLEGL